MNKTLWSDCVGAGWRNVVDKAVADIQECEGGYVVQVKEKFGGLRIYAYGEGVDEICDRAEKAVKNVCEFCGRDGKIHTIRGWYKTLCEDCHKEFLDAGN